MEESQAPTVLGDSFYNVSSHFRRRRHGAQITEPCVDLLFTNHLRHHQDPSQLSQALRQRAGSDNPLHFTTSTESHPSGNTASAGIVAFLPHLGRVDVLQPVILPRPGHAPPTRRAAATKYVKPALSTHHSAPTSTAIMSDLVGALKMHHTFNGMDAPGDTQPDSQMHKQWTSGLHAPPVEVRHAPKSLFVDHDDEDDNELPSDEMEGVDSSQEHHEVAITSPTVIDLDEQHEHAHDSLAMTSPLKFETPALAGRKRHGPNQMQSSAVRTNTTPGTVASASAFGAAFGNVAFAGGADMSLTQVWNNTQAPTSPAVDGAADDIVFTRPSPNFTNVRHSSPGPSYSSPIKAARPETPRSDPLVRSSSEPRVEYVTMKQSQEKRRSSKGENGHAVLIQQDSWEELSRQVQLKKAKAQFHRQAARSLSHISAPKSTSRSKRKQTVSSDYPSPGRSRDSRKASHRGQEEEDDDSLDELSQPSPAKAHGAEGLPADTLHTLHTTTRTTKVQVPKTSSHPYRTPSGQASRSASQQASASSQLQRESQSRAPGSQSLLRGAMRPDSSKDSVAVMDSQPDVLADFDSVPPPKSLRFPSSPSTNEYSINQTTMATKTGYTSQVISSSMPPLPPKSSPEGQDDVQGEDTVVDEMRVPSSPPLLTHDEDVDYDEHAYDEYLDAGAHQDVMEGAAGDDDMVNEEQDDLPVTEAEAENIDEPKGVAYEDSDEEAMDAVQAQQVDPSTDDEVPETLPHDRLDDDQPLAARKMSDTQQQTCRLERQDTVPETDGMDETQPSFFPKHMPVDSTSDNMDLPPHTDSTGRFQTAKEEQSGWHSNEPVPLSSRDEGSDNLGTSHRVRSISDIYNLPATQQSTAEEDVEMPRLSGIDEEFGGLGRASSPADPPSKRRRITYAAKGNNLRSPIKPMSNSLALCEPPPSPSAQEEQRAQNNSPPTASAVEREGRGESAAARARGEAQAQYTKPATLKGKLMTRDPKPQKQKKGALKPVSKELKQTLSSPKRSAEKPRGSVPIRAKTPMTPTKPRPVMKNNANDVVPPPAEDDADELAGPTPQPVNINRIRERLGTPSETPPDEKLVPHRVFASWPGSHYYPATCIGRAATRQLRVRYDDGNTTTIDAVHVRALDIRIGDHVKVDEVGMKKHTYVVVGVKDRIDSLMAEQYPCTDQRGYATVLLEEKPRESMPKQKLMQPATQVSVPMASIYLTTGLWARLRDRTFVFLPSDSPASSVSRVGTPIIESFTSPSFTRRGTAIPPFLKDATARAASVASTSRSGSGVFTNMAFVLTSTTVDVDKEAIAKTIKANGGQILEHGFHELFEYESSGESSSQSRRRSASAMEGTDELALKHAHNDLGFVALISDAHSRSTKYIQALALNVPCLHLRWIQDSLAAFRAAPLSKYLLPAGVSKFLDPHGVVRSRTMQIYDPAAEETSFAKMIQDRFLLLHNQTVLLVTGKSKKEMEKRQPFVFLTHALGSASVGRCADLADASEMLTEGHWDWVYIDSGERSVADAAAELFGTEKPAVDVKAKKGKKRKRDESEENEELIARVEIGGRKIRITCAEFVIQSLILGALIEE